MADFQSDAFVFFGATGDLAYKQIFPSLQGLIRDEGFNLPIVGVAKAGWNLDQFKARAKDSLEKHGGLDQDAFGKMCIRDRAGIELTAIEHAHIALHLLVPCTLLDLMPDRIADLRILLDLSLIHI